MKSSVLARAGALLSVSLLLGGCHSSVTTTVSLYHPKVRLWELEAKARDAKEAKQNPPNPGHQQGGPNPNSSNKPDDLGPAVQSTLITPMGTAAAAPDPEVLRYLSPEEQSAYLQLWHYARENPSMELKDPYPSANFLKLCDQIQAHVAVASQLRAFVENLAEPERKKLVAALEEAINRYENAAAEKQVAETSRSPAKGTTDDRALSVEVSRAQMQKASQKLKDQDLKTETLGRQVEEALKLTVEGAHRALAKARTDYAAARSKLPVVRVHELDTTASDRRNIEDRYRGEVENATRSFLLEFWGLAEFPAVLGKIAELPQAPVARDPATFTAWLAQEIDLPSDLVQIYSSDQQRRIPLRLLLPAASGGAGSGPRLGQLVAQLTPVPSVPPPPGDSYHTEQVADPIISIAARDQGGWQDTPSYVQQTTNSRNDFLIVRESLTRYHAVAMRDTPSTTVDASMRLAVATGAVIMEVAQTVAGLNLGVSLPVGGMDDATDTAGVNELRSQISPWTADKLRQIARIRADRVRQLLARQPKDADRNSADWQAWNAEASGLLSSHRDVSSGKSEPPAKENPTLPPDGVAATPAAPAAPVAPVVAPAVS